MRGAQNQDSLRVLLKQKVIKPIFFSTQTLLSFESTVKTKGYQTAKTLHCAGHKFESTVNLYTIKLEMELIAKAAQFESTVKTRGYQTYVKI